MKLQLKLGKHVFTFTTEQAPQRKPYTKKDGFKHPEHKREVWARNKRDQRRKKAEQAQAAKQ